MADCLASLGFNRYLNFSLQILKLYNSLQSDGKASFLKLNNSLKQASIGKVIVNFENFSCNLYVVSSPK